MKTGNFNVQNALPTPHKIQCISITKSVELIVFMEINVVNFGDISKYINILWGENSGAFYYQNNGYQYIITNV